jgi:hypothetical protein
VFYTYILQSVSSPDQLYDGHSCNLKQRLSDRSAGHCPHTAKFRPWKVKFYASPPPSAAQRASIATSKPKSSKSLTWPTKKGLTRTTRSTGTHRISIMRPWKKTWRKRRIVLWSGSIGRSR